VEREAKGKKCRFFSFSPHPSPFTPHGCKHNEVENMLRVIIVIISIFMSSFIAHAEEVSKEQIKGLDEQVQEIKSDVLSIAAELNQLEEKLLYPSHTQVAFFVSLARGEDFRLDSVGIMLDGKQVAQHLYTFKELEAMKKGGVQRIYTGNVRIGEHEMQVTLMGMSKGGNNFQKMEKFKVLKDVAPKIVEITLAQQSIIFKDR
jgi:hypothetical protein